MFCTKALFGALFYYTKGAKTMKDDKNMNEKENKGAEKSSRDRRLDAYRDWILDIVSATRLEQNRHR